MSTKVVMEALSPTMEEGRLVEWKKQEGDTVAVGDVLAVYYYNPVSAQRELVTVTLE